MNLGNGNFGIQNRAASEGEAGGPSATPRGNDRAVAGLLAIVVAAIAVVLIVV